jgi:hypothetical protein
MHNIPNKSSNSSKTLHRPTIQSQSNQKATYWAIPTRNGKFPQRVIQTMYNDVIWF